MNLESFKEQNGYTIDDVWYPRVTSICGIKHKPALTYFYAAAESYADANRKKDLAASEGKVIHEMIEKVIRGEEPTVAEHQLGFREAFREFLGQHSFHARREWIERRVKHPTHRYSGTFDLLAEVDGVFSLVDIKTSSGIWPDYALQTSAYLYALNDEPWLSDEKGKRTILPKAVEKRYVLRLNQVRRCDQCGAIQRVREMGDKIINGKNKNGCVHSWGPLMADWELKEFSNNEIDFKGFLHCKGVWEWECRKELEELGYL